MASRYPIEMVMIMMKHVGITHSMEYHMIIVECCG